MGLVFVLVFVLFPSRLVLWLLLGVGRLLLGVGGLLLGVDLFLAKDFLDDLAEF